MRLKTTHRAWLTTLMLVAAQLWAAEARAGGLRLGDDDKNLRVGLLLQGWGALTPGAAPDTRHLGTDFYLRRMRLMLYGQMTRWVHYFVETDSPNLGKSGDASGTIFIQDAWVELNVHKALQLNVGMLLIPFSHQGMQGAASLHSVDYHSAVMRYPRGSHKVWRDWGIMARGQVLGDHLGYRVAVLDGVQGGEGDPRNPRGWPRVTARLTVNVFEAEGGPGAAGFFWDGLYLKRTARGLISPRRVLSFGVSVDWQKDLNVTRRLGELDPTLDTFVARRRDYLAVAADAFFDLPLTRSRRLGLAGQVNFYYYDHGDRRPLADGASRSFYGLGAGGGEYSGYGLATELGLRYDQWGIFAAVDWFDAIRTDGAEGDHLALYGGLNWWWRGHAMSFKVQLGGVGASGGELKPVVLLQVQLLL